jgi:hypothetical protein
VDAHDNIVAGLVEFYTPSEISAQWQQVHTSLLQRASETVTINSKTIDGRTTSAISLTGAEEKHAYIAACRDALAQIAGTAPTSGRPTLTDFSEGPVLV